RWNRKAASSFPFLKLSPGCKVGGSHATGKRSIARGLKNRSGSGGTKLAKKRRNVSAGLLLFRRSSGGLECFLAHPGGPFWRNRHEGAWTIPKGLVEEDESPMEAALREFREETGLEPHADGAFLELGSVRLKSG